ncbi:uncharacterized protein LOC124912672 [Impatiens glandulifera]|uniref:uncharacterized protein LOC124912672 n=1 Tax=Impatiens glandulifera TaxID=253017 RepID=UPI001FB055F6|nr:uncharacterized protein LOC124912672 [Impatiens glandulifera]
MSSSTDESGESIVQSNQISTTIVPSAGASIDTDSDGDFNGDDFYDGDEEFRRKEGVNRGLINALGQDDLDYFYPQALFCLANFNFNHDTDFVFEKIVRGWFGNGIEFYLIFEASSPRIAGGKPLVFQSYIGMFFGRLGGHEIEFCRLHPIDCAITLEDLPICANLDHTQHLVHMSSVYATFCYGNWLRLKFGLGNIISFDKIVEPTLLEDFAFGYKIIFSAFEKKDVSRELKTCEAVVVFRQDLSVISVRSIIEMENQNEKKVEI